MQEGMHLYPRLAMEKSDFQLMIESAQLWFECLRAITVCVQLGEWESLEPHIYEREWIVTQYMALAEAVNIEEQSVESKKILRELLTFIQNMEQSLIQPLENYQKELSESFNSVKMEAVLQKKYDLE
jgi:hypothetical protein